MYLKKRTGNYIPVITCDSNKTLLTYVYIYSKNNIYTQRFYFHASHPFFYIFHKIPFHLKNLWIWCPPFFHTIHQCFFCVKVLSKGNVKYYCKFVRVLLMQIHVQQNGLRYCKDLPGNPNQFFMVLDFRLDFNTEAKGES